MIPFLRWALLYLGLGLALVYHLGLPSNSSGQSHVIFVYQQF